MYRHLIPTLLLVVMAMPVFGQFHHQRYENMPEWMQKYVQGAYWALQYPSMTLQTENRFTPKSLDPSVTPLDTSFKLSHRSGFGIGIAYGSFFRLKEYMSGNILALDVSLSANYTTWNFKELKGVSSSAETKASVTHYAVPIALLYKHGVDAEFNEELKYMYSFGIGVEPSSVRTRYFQIEGNNALVRPFVVAEAGIFKGTAWKLRASYFPLNNTYYDGTAPGGDGTMKLKMTGSQCVNISLIIMAGCNHWNE